MRPEEVAPALGGTGGWEASLGGPAAPAGGKEGPQPPGLRLCSFLILLSFDISLCLKWTKPNGQGEGENEVLGQVALCVSTPSREPEHFPFG